MGRGFCQQLVLFLSCVNFFFLKYQKLIFIEFLKFHIMTIQNILKRNITSYIQGQSPEKKVREYFYYIDHQGMVKI